ncbi:MAG: hypothetical protein RLY86_1267 [Pseudomonadota bacterium]|jgi:Bax protein
MTMEEEGRGAPRWPAVGAIALTILLVVPLTVTGLVGSGRLPFAPAATIPVTRTADAGPAGTDATAPVAGLKAAPAAPRVTELRLDAATLLDLFRGQDYRIEHIRTGTLPVPRVKLASMPRDMGGEAISPDDRKQLFIKTMLPLVLMANERIGADRARLQHLHGLREAGHGLSQQDQVWLADLADRYGLDRSEGVDTTLLLRRVDLVPVSLTLAQAAEESGWGTSRFAQQGNALFGQLTWSPDQAGIAPRNRQPGESHRFRSFEDLFASVQAYMHNLNTHRAYLDFRRQRASLRKADKPLDGLHLAGTLVRYSERGQGYVGALRQLIRVNDLNDFDRATLVDGGAELVVRLMPVKGPGKGPGKTAAAPPAADGQAAGPTPAALDLDLPPAPDAADTAAVETEDGRY